MKRRKAKKQTWSNTPLRSGSPDVVQKAVWLVQSPQVIALDKALSEVQARSQALPGEEVPLAQAGGRILSRPIAAARDLPGTDISMMDGYALRSADAAQA